MRKQFFSSRRNLSIAWSFKQHCSCKPLAHASGLFTRYNEPLAGFGLDEFQWPNASSDDLEKIGHVTFEGRSIPCFGGYGDLQTSVAGIQPPDKQDWIINLGTGSQIISFVEPAEDAFELRQYFQNVTVHCVTHIPAGRALNVWARFFQLVRDETNPDYFWRMLRSAGLQISPAKTPAFDLAIFHEAFGYDGGERYPIFTKTILDRLNSLRAS